LTLATGSKLGTYEILGPLGAGGMGEVYRARDPQLEREVAIKVLPSRGGTDPDRLRRFEREARSASTLNHPNIVAIHAIGEEKGVSYIAMELVDGKTLRDLLFGDRIPLKRLLSISAQIADGLARAHQSGIVHRDLKPENVMVTREGNVKILDFGLAKWTHPDPEEGEKTSAPTISQGTEPGIVMGTAGYMSPEQALGKPLDFRSDQFALGSVVYEMAAGKRPFERANVHETLAAIIRDEPEPIAAAAPGAPVALSWIVERCMAKDPDERYGSTRDLARDLARLRDAVSLGVVTTSGSAAVAPPPARRVARWLVPAVLVLAAAAAAWGIAQRRHDEPPVYRALTFRRGVVSNARFAPDGHTVLYGAAWQGGPYQIYSTRTDSTASTLLPLPAADILAISSGGKMAVQSRRDRGRVLAETSIAGGEPREIAEGIEAADYDPAGDRMLVQRGDRLELPPGKVLYDPGPDRGVYRARFSPDGRLVAFIQLEGPLNSVRVVDLAGKSRVLSSGWDTVWSLAWHPKTGEVWFSARPTSGSRVMELYAVSLSGRLRVVARGPLPLLLHDISQDGRALVASDEWTETMMALPPGASRESDLSWLDDSVCMDISADGRTLVFTEGGMAEGAAGGVYLRKTDGAPAVRLGDGEAHRLSPDEKWVIVRRGSSYFVMPTGAGETKPLTTGGLADVEWPRWFPDGKTVLFNATAAGQQKRAWAVPADGGTPRPVTPEKYEAFGVSPDGRTLFGWHAGDRKAFVLSIGGEPRFLPGVPPEDSFAGVDAAGTGLFLFQHTTPLRIFHYDVASDRHELWKEISVADPAGLRRFNTMVVTPDGKSYAYTFWRSLSHLYVVEGLK
jgi:hypothetical protein